MALAPEQAGIGIRRHFTTEGTHPYDKVEWERRDARITNFRDGSVAFEQLDVEFPVDWSLNATNIVAQKYFRGTARHPRARVVAAPGRSTGWSTPSPTGALADGYFVDDRRGRGLQRRAQVPDRQPEGRLQLAGVVQHRGARACPSRPSACFILAVDDKMDSILNWYVEEGTIFKGGSGSGINLQPHPLRHGAAQGRRHRLGPGQLHARRRRLGRHHQVRRQDPPRRQDGHPRRRPPRHRGVHLVQGHARSRRPGPSRPPAST